MYGDPLHELRQAEGNTGVCEMLMQRDSGARLAEYLPAIVTPSEAADSTTVQQWVWERCGTWLMAHGRWHEALLVFQALYHRMLDFQVDADKRTHKGMPLVWMSDCYRSLGYRVHARRYIMLTLIEDAIADEGKILPEGRGVYFRAVHIFGLPERQLSRYGMAAYNRHQAHQIESRFPEWVLQEFDQDWMAELPSVEEALHYDVNPRFVRWLIGQLGKSADRPSDGKALERIAQYLLGSIAGCRAIMRARTPSTDYDVVCGLEGIGLDFRSDLGRYFLCECKDWDRAANVDVITKFCSVLDSTKSRFGVIFAKQGITGARDTTAASRERLKTYQRQDIAVVVVDENDLEKVASGENLTALIRAKYEEVRFDLRKVASAVPAPRRAGKSSITHRRTNPGPH